MNMFTPTSATTPAEYLDALPEPRQADVRVLLIRHEAPGLEPHLQSGMLAYGRYAYRTKADIGRSCVRIKRLSDVDLDVVADLVRQAAAWTPPAVG